MKLVVLKFGGTSVADVPQIKKIALKYSQNKITTIDGLKIDFEDSWVQLRKSNTEPIVRVYSEAKSQSLANDLSSKFILEIKKSIQN